MRDTALSMVTMIRQKYDEDMYQALQMRAIYDHQWIMGVNEHHEVEKNEAGFDFVKRYGKQFREFYEAHLEEILEMCRQHCRPGCKGRGNCDLDDRTLHEMIKLKDD